MSVATQPHPPKAVLTAFSTGSLREPAASEVADHLLDCDPCTQRLLGLQSEDTLLDLLKQQEVPVHSGTSNLLTSSASTSESKAFELLSDHPRYELLELVGRGGMGDVFRGRHRLMDREVAIKFLNAPRWRKRLQQREAVLRFQREVKAAAKLSHPNIVTAFDAEECNGVHYFVMEYIAGENLASYVKQQGPLSIKDAFDCLRQVCLGLEVAHRQGMVHRDVKPHNLMVSRVDQDQLCVTILDFGIASLGLEQHRGPETQPSSGLTHSGRVVGTPEYISPEQALGTSSVDCRADIYSLGATLYFLLMGRPPFVGTCEELFALHKHASPPECKALSNDPELSSLLNKMLAKSPDDRFQSITELRDSLDFIQSDSAVPVPPKTSYPFKKASIMTAVLAIASCVLATFAMWPDDEGFPQTPVSDSSVVSATEAAVSANTTAETPTTAENKASVAASAKPILVNANQPKNTRLEIAPSILPPDKYVYFSRFLREIKFENAEGDTVRKNIQKMFNRVRGDGDWIWVQIKLEDGGEAYLSRDTANRLDGRVTVVGRIREAKDTRGTIYCPASDGKSMTEYPFTISKKSWRSDKGISSSFFRVMASDYNWLAKKNLAGTAWFRARANYALRVLRQVHEQKDVLDGANPGMTRGTGYERTFDMFTGSTAVVENLQLDRMLRRASKENAVVPVESIPGITIAGYDWSELTRGINPKTDALAEFIPHDQHAFFFSNFGALLQTIARVQVDAATVMQLLQMEGNGADLFARYQTELGLSMNDLAELLGPQLIKSVAVTGSDPYFDLGTDVALLLEPKQSQALRQLLEAQITLSASKRNASVNKSSGKEDGLAYDHFSSDDGKLNSYLVAAPGYVAVTNSLGQLKRLAAVLREDASAKLSLAEEPEYRYFRELYPISKKNKRKGLLVISDATIRRWCGPRMRIANSRRLHARGALGALQADAYHQSMLIDAEKHPSLNLQRYHALVGKIKVENHRARSETFGAAGDLTPLIDLPITHVSREEKTSYTAWRDSYQRRWRGAFDPIALHFELDQTLDFDLTVMPLIAGSQYAFVKQILSPAKIDPAGADPHEETVVHMAASFNSFAKGILVSSIGARDEVVTNAMDWIGETVSLYVDWDESIKDLPESWNDFEQLPFGLTIELQEGKDEDKLFAFLRNVSNVFHHRDGAWSDSSYKKKKIHSYKHDDFGREIDVHLVLVGRVLLLSPNLAVIHRAIDREQNGSGAVFAKQDKGNWLGDHMNVKISGEFTELLEKTFEHEFQRELTYQSWCNVPVLNEWKKHLPQRDSVELHNSMWHQQLIAVDGSGYEWDESLRSMKATHYGPPGDEITPGHSIPPVYRNVKSAAAGITFVNDGIRARVQIERE